MNPTTSAAVRLPTVKFWDFIESLKRDPDSVLLEDIIEDYQCGHARVAGAQPAPGVPSVASSSTSPAALVVGSPAAGLVVGSPPAAALVVGSSAAASSILELSGNKVTGHVRCIAGRCKRRTCPQCGPVLGYSVRNNLRAKSALWRVPCLLTLTIDRERYGSAQEAHAAVTGGKFIPRLMGRLGVKLWMWCLEFQSKTGEGWPHWHLLIDLADLPDLKVNLGKAWRLWRDDWRLGGLHLSNKLVNQQMEVGHALNYITKYLTKQPEGGYPEWVLHSETIRFVQGCRRLGPLVGRSKETMEESIEEEDSEENREQARKSNLQAMSFCGLTTNLMQEQIDQDTGELSFKWMATLPVSPGVLETLSGASVVGMSNMPATVHRLRDRAKQEKSYLVMQCPDLRELTRWIEAAKPQEWIHREVEEKRKAILANNQFALRRAAAAADTADFAAAVFVDSS